MRGFNVVSIVALASVVVDGFSTAPHQHRGVRLHRQRGPARPLLAGSHHRRALESPWGRIARTIDSAHAFQARDSEIITAALKGKSEVQSFRALDGLADKVDRFASRSRKPGLMDAINIMRCNVCGARPNMWEHDKCNKFLTGLCKKGELCKEVCAKFLAGLKGACNDAEHDEKEREEHCAQCKEMNGGESCKQAENPDRDGDGVKNEDDAFPDDPKEWKDSDGDGIGDNADKDRDNDGVENDKDAFPEDPEETKDLDKDGIGDNADPDRDGDGHNNDEDKFPDDPKEWKDSDEDGIGDNSDPDLDGDGYDNGEDVFHEDPEEWKDLDKDGIGNNADPERDGDGHDNDKDLFPDDPENWKDSDGDGIGDASDHDRDGDGHNNKADEFPDDPTKSGKASHDRDGDEKDDGKDAFPDHKDEWGDSDGDGHGDSTDAYPKNPDCYTDTLPCDDPHKKVKSREKEFPPIDPTTLNKDHDGGSWRAMHGLPDEGYDEHSKDIVKHVDQKTQIGNWGKEWPVGDHLPEEEEHIAKMCADNPKNSWCGRWRFHRRFAR